ncbi:unnamed protein product [Heterobilharzia americana]|nr:unnamed protein product [Heterobilharzia americana]
MGLGLGSAIDVAVTINASLFPGNHHHHNSNNHSSDTNRPTRYPQPTNAAAAAAAAAMASVAPPPLKDLEIRQVEGNDGPQGRSNEVLDIYVHFVYLLHNIRDIAIRVPRDLQIPYEGTVKQNNS